MAKSATNQFVCSHCGALSVRWAGQCTECGEWNTISESSGSHRKGGAFSMGAGATTIHSIDIQPDVVIPSGIPEFDRVLGSGIVAGSAILVGGEPGIGKSTLALQVAAVVGQHVPVLYVTGEESLNQVRLRADRLGAVSQCLYVLAETNLDTIMGAIERIKPTLVILDSIQVVVHPDIPAVAGTVNQVRHCASVLIKALKQLGGAGIIIGHITKDGALAGPKVLEHLVDVILYFEGENSNQFRILRSFKNRYSSTNEIGIFSMESHGLVDVGNPSGLFVDESTLNSPGSMVIPVSEGSRIFLVEVQALVVDTGFGMGRRTILGVDSNRAHLLIAAMEKIVGIKLAAKDIILNIVGGYKTSEPALDLGVVLAIFSSAQDLPVKRRIAVIGEVGLTGEIRPVPHVERRLMELDKMGFEACVVPSRNNLESTFGKLRLIPVESLQEALRVIIQINS